MPCHCEALFLSSQILPCLLALPGRGAPRAARCSRWSPRHTALHTFAQPAARLCSRLPRFLGVLSLTPPASVICIPPRFPLLLPRRRLSCLFHLADESHKFHRVGLHPDYWPTGVGGCIDGLGLLQAEGPPAGLEASPGCIAMVMSVRWGTALPLSLRLVLQNQGLKNSPCLGALPSLLTAKCLPGNG